MSGIWRVEGMTIGLKILSFGLLFVVLVFGVVPGSVLAADRMREDRIWTSRVGSEFFGRLKDVRDGEAVLRGPDGREMVVSVEQLSADDRTYLREDAVGRHREVLEFYRGGDFHRAAVPPTGEIQGVPHVAQYDNFCVPASTEMVLRYYGFPYDQDQLAELISKDSARSLGTNFLDLVRALRNLGIDSALLPMSGKSGNQRAARELMNGIKKGISEGYPVILSYKSGEMGHAVTAVCYDDRRKAFWVMDPLGHKKPTQLDYDFLERFMTGAVMVVPKSAEIKSQPQDIGKRAEFLRKISSVLRSTSPTELRGLENRLKPEGIAAQWRDMNRIDLRFSQGQTRSYARRDGVEFIKIALDRGAVVVAPQQFDSGPGTILVYGIVENEFQAVEYLSDGTFRKKVVSLSDFSLRWIWREGREYFLPVVEIEALPGFY